MKLINDSGANRVIALMRPHLKPRHQLGCVTPSFSLFAFAELRDVLAKLERVQLILPPADDGAGRQRGSLYRKFLIGISSFPQCRIGNNMFPFVHAPTRSS